MPIRKLKDYLDENNVRYVTIHHSQAFTAQEVAASAHVPGRELAKTVIVKIDGDLAMCVLPASYLIDVEQLKETSGAADVRLASEQDFKDKFGECEVGAMPPFGNLYNMDVYVAGALTEDDEIAFNAGSHTELIRMSYQDFERLVKPKVLRFSHKMAM